MGRGMELTRPSIIATLLWALGVFVIGLAVYSLIFWEGGLTTLDLHDSLLIFVAFSSGINAIATGVSSTCTPCDTKQVTKPTTNMWDSYSR